MSTAGTLPRKGEPEHEQAEGEESLSPAEQRKVTLYRILLRTYSRVMADNEGRSLRDLDESDLIAYVERWDAAIKHDLLMFSEVMEAARHEGIASAMAALRKIDTIPGDLLDRAMEDASERAHEERERLLTGRDGR